MADLSSALQHLLKASRISGNKNSYKKDNPSEFNLVKAYIDGGARPNVSTEMGLGLREVEDVKRESVPPDPPDPPDPPTTAYDYLGNSFGGENYNNVTHCCEAAAVSPDGLFAVVGNWSEAAKEMCTYDATGPVGVRGALHPDGSIAVHLSNAYIWCVSRTKIRRFPKAGWVNGEWANVTFDTGFTLTGITVSGSEVYVADGSNIHVYPSDLSGVQVRQFAANGAKMLTTDRQGNIWALRGAKLTRYSPAGAELANITPAVGYMLDVAADPNSDKLLVSDNGQDQNLKFLDYSGAVTGTFGARFGYLAGPTPGLLGPLRFCGPRGVGIDAAGNIYVAMFLSPGIGSLAWGEIGNGLIVESYSAAGVLRWHWEGLMFVDQGSPCSDESRFYGRQLSYTKTAGRYALRAFTLDPWANLTDRRIEKAQGNVSITTVTRDLGTRRYLTQFGNSASGLQIYRMNGEVAVPSCYVSNQASDDFIQVEGMARENRPGNIPGNINGSDIWMDAVGDVWRLGLNTYLMRYILQGYTAQGDPIYHYANTNVWAVPPQFAQARRIEVHGSNIYVIGYGPGEVPPDQEFDGWKWAGKRIAKYTSFPTGTGTWPTPAWNVQLHYNTDTTNYLQRFDKPQSMAVSESAGLVAVAYSGEAGTYWNRGYLRFYSTATGAETRVVQNADFPAAYGERGQIDMPRGITFTGDWVWMEDDCLSKQVGVEA